VEAERVHGRGVRRTHRHSYKSGPLATQVRTLGLRGLQTMDCRFYQSALQLCQHSKVAVICRELFSDELNHETVSQFAGHLDEHLEPWRTRPLAVQVAHGETEAASASFSAESRVGGPAGAPRCVCGDPGPLLGQPVAGMSAPLPDERARRPLKK